MYDAAADRPACEDDGSSVAETGVDLSDLRHRAKLFSELEGRENMRRLVDAAVQALKGGADVDQVREIVPGIVGVVGTRGWDQAKFEGREVVGRAIEIDELLQLLG